MDLEAIKYAILSFLEKVQPFFPFVLGFDIALTCYNEIFKEETTSIMKGCDIIFVAYFLKYGNLTILLFNLVALLVFSLVDKKRNFHKSCILCDIILSLVAICLTFSQDNLIVMLNTAIIISITICKLIAIFSKQIVIEEEEFIQG